MKNRTSNQSDESVKNKKQQAILKIIQSEKFKTQPDIVKRLEEDEIFVAQGTVSRYIKEMNIIKGEDGVYRITNETLHEMHLSELRALLKENSLNYYKNVAYHYIKVGEGKASLFAFHLQQAFPEVILEVAIGEDSLTLLVNMDKASTEFFALLEHD